MIIQGKIIKYGDNVDTDVIIPARYLNTSSKEELASHCMEDIDKKFKEKTKTANIIIAGFNFGCGSSREHAPIAILASGVKCVLAKSFARIFYRNAINIGLPIIECAKAAEDASENDEFYIDFEKGEIENITKSKCYKFAKMPDFVGEIIKTGGLIEAVKKDMFSLK